MPKDITYLDYNATAPVLPGVVDVMRGALALTGNPSSVHRAGRAARALVEDARRQVAAAVNADSEQVMFTGSGSEANNTALLYTGARRLLVSAIEHDSVLAPAQMSGVPVGTLPVDADGVIDLEALERALAKGGQDTLVSLMLANNETGVIQPVADAARLAHEAGATIHCDAIQGLGKIPVDSAALDVDSMSLSAHKLGGPQGVGALVFKPGLDIMPLIRGGGQERRRRAGTENVAGVAGFGVAAADAPAMQEKASQRAHWRDRWEARVLSAFPDAMIASAGVARLANTSCVAVPGVPSEMQLMALDLEGVCVSAGSACSSGKVAPSHVLKAMGYDDDSAASAIRVSLGWGTAENDVDKLFEVWSAFISRTRERAVI